MVKKKTNKGSKEKVKDKKHLEYGTFKMKTGDKYTGYYSTKPNGDVFRHGRGVYETKEGQIYDGVWAMDHLVSTEPIRITYDDGCMYEGSLHNYQYDGFGIYTFNNNATMQCQFRKNKPVLKVELIDPNGYKWAGNAVNDRYSLLKLRNIFYDTIPHKLGLPSYQPSFEIKNSEDVFETNASSGQSFRTTS